MNANIQMASQEMKLELVDNSKRTYVDFTYYSLA